MPFPPNQFFGALARRRNAITNSLDLTRSLTIHLTAWLTVRFALSFTSRRFFAELRDDVVLLYPAEQLLHHASSPFTLQSIQRQTHTALSSIAQLVPPNHVLSFAVEATRFVQRSKTTLVLRTKGRLNTRLIFDSHHERSAWLNAVAANLNRPKKNLSDFELIKHVGKGASGRVYKVRDTTTNEMLALKVIDKSYVFESQSSYRHAMEERVVLQIVRDHPFVLDMRYAFQNAKRLFLVTEFCGGGDMFEFLNSSADALDEHTTRFVACEVLLAIEHIHNLGIVYRDLKLENILIDAHGHIRLADFGLTKVLRQGDGSLCRTNTFCGTKEYVAPEMIRGDSYDMSLDFWALGILLYEMMSGKTPFYHDDHDLIYDRIKKAPIFFPAKISTQARSLISALLKRQPAERLGTGSMGLEQIKMHEWFKDIDWNDVRAKKIESPLRKRLDRGRASLDEGALSPSGRKRRQEQRKAMAVVQQDVKQDMKYVSTLGSDVSIAHRARAPMEKRRGGILAGYCFRAPKARQTRATAPAGPPPPCAAAVAHSGADKGASECAADDKCGSACASVSVSASDSTCAGGALTTSDTAGSEKDVLSCEGTGEPSQCSLSSQRKAGAHGDASSGGSDEAGTRVVGAAPSGAAQPDAAQAVAGAAHSGVTAAASSHYPHLRALLKSCSGDEDGECGEGASVGGSARVDSARGDSARGDSARVDSAAHAESEGAAAADAEGRDCAGAGRVADDVRSEDEEADGAGVEGGGGVKWTTSVWQGSRDGEGRKAGSDGGDRVADGDGVQAKAKDEVMGEPVSDDSAVFSNGCAEQQCKGSEDAADCSDAGWADGGGDGAVGTTGEMEERREASNWALGRDGCLEGRGGDADAGGERMGGGGAVGDKSGCAETGAQGRAAVEEEGWSASVDGSTGGCRAEGVVQVGKMRQVEGCGADSVATEVYIAKAFVRSPTSIQDVGDGGDGGG